eukprot:CAMPEP_0183329270 /NCGR_PEP_ID=MMETSP0160_2-20130417/84709_1 /TAXON_ID=2839 ORGANISM="Odontella Sinensis, Strain Grunow 1884" /NCGR_SAMPLE_ID=MMETSP0160_2 /ASSEMBLY_ACC=CAM_ASM_000250 /LENGTH=451 /DNA_ID=CAMNT_0025497459 /DNA_START=424 /DNA_END=1779 /DNA_ORIENTATION=-
MAQPGINALSPISADSTSVGAADKYRSDADAHSWVSLDSKKWETDAASRSPDQYQSDANERFGSPSAASPMSATSNEGGDGGGGGRVGRVDSLVGSTRRKKETRGGRRGRPARSPHSDYDTDEDEEDGSFDYRRAEDEVTSVGSRSADTDAYASRLLKEATNGGKGGATRGDAEYYPVRQRYGFFSILISLAQVFLLVVLMTLCGVAPLEVNPLIGPYPDALSEWGGKNPYLISRAGQWWRILTAPFLSVGAAHMLLNVAAQLEAAAFFEREWGSGRWIVLYMASAAGGTILGCIVDPDSVSVISTPALVGLFGAKLSEILCCYFFEQDKRQLEGWRPPPGSEQIGGVLCWSTLLTLLGLAPYMEFSAIGGGAIGGFVVGMVVFSCNIRKPFYAITWFLSGFILTLIYFTTTVLYLLFKTKPNQDLLDACEYYRDVYEENYDCECAWMFEW